MDALDLFPLAGIRFISVAHEQGGGHMADGYSRVSGRHGVCIAQNGPGHHQFRHVDGGRVLGAFAGRRHHAGDRQRHAGPRRLPGDRAAADLLEDHEVPGARQQPGAHGRAHGPRVRPRAARARARRSSTSRATSSTATSSARSRGRSRSSAARAASRASTRRRELLAGAQFPGDPRRRRRRDGRRAGRSRSRSPSCCRRRSRNSYLHNDSFPARHPLWVRPARLPGQQGGDEADRQGRRRAGARHAPRSVRHAAAVRHRLLAEGREGHPGRRRREDAGPREADLASASAAMRGGGAARSSHGCRARRSPASRTRTRASPTIAATKKAWEAELDGWAHEKDAWSLEVSKDSTYMHPRQMLRELEQRDARRARWCRPTSATSARCRTRYLRFDRPRSMFAAMSFGNCGYAFPTIVGAKVAAPDRPAIAYVGDGAWGMSFGELADLRAREHSGHRRRVQQRPVGRGEEEPRRLLRQPLRRREPRQAAVVGRGGAGDGRRGHARSTSSSDVGPALRAAAKAQSDGKTTCSR